MQKEEKENIYSIFSLSLSSLFHSSGQIEILRNGEKER